MPAHEGQPSDPRVPRQHDAVREGARVLVVDDLIATRGTAMAAVRLLRRASANIVGADRVRQRGVPCHSLVSFRASAVVVRRQEVTSFHGRELERCQLEVVPKEPDFGYDTQSGPSQCPSALKPCRE